MNTFAEIIILCHTAARKTHSVNLVQEVLEMIQVSLASFLLPHNTSYFVRVIARTKTYDDLRIPRGVPMTLVKYVISEALKIKKWIIELYYQNMIKKEAFETKLYYLSDLALINEELNSSNQNLFDTIFIETYTYLNEPFGCGNFFYNKASNIVDTISLNLLTSKSVDDNSDLIIKALDYYSKATGFFCIADEYFLG
ncbi:hypothetical protein QTN25_008092 [Entamoeba marina]